MKLQTARKGEKGKGVGVEELEGEGIGVGWRKGWGKKRVLRHKLRRSILTEYFSAVQEECHWNYEYSMTLQP